MEDFILVQQAMIRRGFLMAASTLGQRWLDYTEKYQALLVRTWS